jgi:hypothetical protein
LDLDKLHTAGDELYSKEDAIVHWVNRHVNYFEQLDGTVQFNYQDIANLSTTHKEITLKTQECFKTLILS